MNTARTLPPSPPARGSFPLDHDGACKTAATAFLQCMKETGGSHADCRELSKSYLACRMDKGLMAQEDLNTLGFSQDARVVAAPEKEEEKKEIIAGLGSAKKRPGFLFGLGGSGTGQRGGGH